MFERFTDQARLALLAAQGHARRLNHPYLDTEHLLLGLLDAPDGTMATALTALGVSPDAVRRRVEEVLSPALRAAPELLLFTPRAKVELALREALELARRPRQAIDMSYETVVRKLPKRELTPTDDRECAAWRTGEPVGRRACWRGCSTRTWRATPRPPPGWPASY